MNFKGKARLLMKPRLQCQTDCLLWSLTRFSVPCQACQEMLAKCYSATCDMSAVIAVTSQSPKQEVTQVKFMQLPVAIDT